MTPVLLLLSAPSGAGKTTVGQGLLGAEPNLRRVVTCTTRTPRPGEVDGLDYHFLSRDEFVARLQAGEFLEHADVYGRFYGTLKATVRDLLLAGHDVLLTIDVQGAVSVRREAAADDLLRGALTTVFYTPGSRSELESRLRSRASDAPDVIVRRLAAAQDELAELPKYDYLVVSGTREEDLARMRTILAAERLRQSRAEFQFGS